LLNPRVINQAAMNIQKSDMQVATLCEQIKTEEHYFDPNCVKVVYNSRGKALYFSRSPIPAFREPSTLDLTLCYRHIGVYAYRVGFLRIYAELGISPIEMAEKLEQLTILNEGYEIHVEPACDVTGIGVDTEEDLIKVKKELRR
jgi:3-deoxy-manno-octulosonate cytidylyltransferase (CMP-KDO synthetase)